MRREAGLLKAKGLASLRRMVNTFNGIDVEGRQSVVVRDLHHAFEMLLKAALHERKIRVFDKKSGRSVGFEKCVRLGGEHLGLSDEQTGLLRTIDALRDDEQHWLAELNEGLLYVHTRAGVTLFDEILADVFVTSDWRRISPNGSCRSPPSQWPTSTSSSTSSTPK